MVPLFLTSTLAAPVSRFGIRLRAEMDFSAHAGSARKTERGIAVSFSNDNIPSIVPRVPDVCSKITLVGECMPLRMRVHDREPIGLALRRFKKLLERSGIQKELRKRKYYEKPCEARRRAKLRKLSAIRKGKTAARGKPYR